MVRKINLIQKDNNIYKFFTLLTDIFSCFKEN